MKITKEEKMYLERCGYGRKDFAQIQEATRRDKTTYEMDGAPMRPLRNLSVRWLETWMSCWKKPVEKKGR